MRGREEKSLRNVTSNYKQMNKENEGKRNRNQSDKGGKYEHFGDTDVKRRKIFQEKWSCQQCQIIENTIKIRLLGSLNMKPLKNVVKA